jgi:hypothetical protein
MATYKGQLDGTWKSHNGFRKWVKKQLNRLHRRMAKENPEDAPKQKRFQGYES